MTHALQLVAVGDRPGELRVTGGKECDYMIGYKRTTLDTTLNAIMECRERAANDWASPASDASFMCCLVAPGLPRLPW